MSYHTPTTLADALALLGPDGPTPIAGGTDLFPSMGDWPDPVALLDVTRIDGMVGITQTSKGWRLGGATAWSAILGADLPRAFDGLKAAAREVGSVQIQNTGTLAGNICNASPAADGLPPLLTLAAEVELASIAGRRRMPLADFVTGVRETRLRADELLIALHIPALPDSAGGGFKKLGARRYLVISIAMAAAVVWPDPSGRIAGARVAVGACSPVAARLSALEETLVGTPLDQVAQVDFTEDHLTPLSPITDVRGSASYRAESVVPVIRQALAQAAEGAGHG